MSTLYVMVIYLQDSSFVFTVEMRNPAMFTVDDLKEEGIITESQNVEDSTYTPFGSHVLYGNGYVFEAREGRAMLLKNFYEEGPLSVSEVSAIPDNLEESALKLVEQLKPLVLESVGINFSLAVVNGSLQNLTRNLPSHAQIGSVGFSIPEDHFLARYSLTAARKNDSSGDEGVLADVNFSGLATNQVSINSRAKHIKGLISERYECLQRARRLLDELSL